MVKKSVKEAVEIRRGEYLQALACSKNNLIFYYATAFHLITGLILILNGERLYTSALTPFYTYLTVYPTVAILLLVSSLLALRGIKKNCLILFIPQLMVVMFMAIYAFSFALQGSYPDGTVRNFYFIFIDQLPSLLLAVFYTYSFIKKAKGN